MQIMHHISLSKKAPTFLFQKKIIKFKNLIIQVEKKNTNIPSDLAICIRLLFQLHIEQKTTMKNQNEQKINKKYE